MDWIGGYGPPPDLFLQRVQKTLAGTDTYWVLNDRYAKEPNNAEVVFKLAQKIEQREAGGDKAKELYRKVVSLDPAGTSGSYEHDYLKSIITYTEAAEEALGRIAFFGREFDPAPLRAFIAKYPESRFLKYEYALLARFYYLRSSVPKDVATQFFVEYTSKYPHDADVLNTYIERIIGDKGPLDKGLELAERAKDLVGSPPNPGYTRNLARLYVLKGDPAKADDVYGKDFIESVASSAVSSLTDYANFWLGQGRNTASVEAMADLAAKMKSDQRTIQTVAGIFLKLKKCDKALAVYGPEFVKNNGGDQVALASYAAYWNRQDANLDSALEAARKAVALTSDYYNNHTLANTLFKLKTYDEALKAAERAVDLVKVAAAKYQGLPTQQYEDLVRQIKDAMAKKKPPAVKK